MPWELFSASLLPHGPDDISHVYMMSNNGFVRSDERLSDGVCPMASSLPSS